MLSPFLDVSCSQAYCLDERSYSEAEYYLVFFSLLSFHNALPAPAIEGRLTRPR